MLLKVENIPLIYTPYFNFPIDKRRKSGFLFPTVGSSSSSGFSVSAPYYFNLAPNYDAIVTPNLLLKRGLKLDGLFRYLTPKSRGEFNLSVLPHDPEFISFRDSAPQLFPSSQPLTDLLHDKATRAYFSWKDKTKFDPHWSSNINYSTVTDDYYFQDLGNTSSVISTNQLLREGSINYSGENWTFLGQLESYQTFHPINQSTILNQYSTLPELNLNGSYPNEAYGLSYQLNTEYVHFTRQFGPGDIVVPPIADRINIQPAVSWPLNERYGYFTPTLQLEATQYFIGNQSFGRPNTITRGLPIFNIDTGLFFDRNVSLFNTHYKQTLEPRLYYLFVPFMNQNNIPVFDSLLQPFNYEQLFRFNRFTGTDRLGDANQIALALTTRYIEKNTGQEKMRASVGQIYYFRNRDVTLCNTPGCQDNLFVPGATSTTEKVSPIVGQAAYHISTFWNAVANLAWDPTSHQTINGNLNFQYLPAPDYIFNAGYNFIRFGDILTTVLPTPLTSNKNNFNQPSVSFAWPINEKWRMMGGYNYNLSHNHPQTYFYGLEYNSCCFAVRLVAGRTFTSINQNNDPVFNNAFYLQWQLKGLGNIGTSDPSSLLVYGIPGYVDNFGQRA